MLFGFYILAWLIFALFDIGLGSDKYKAYTAKERLDFQAVEGLPKFLPNAVYEYRVTDASVVGKVGPYINEHNNCSIFDVDNWTCSHDDDSATFGVQQGNYFVRPNLEKFPHLADYGEEIVLSRFGYILLKCRWDATGGFDAIMCLMRPFQL